MPLLPGAEPFRHEGGETAVLLCHGFTGSPQSMRPWAEHLAGRGLTVSLPLLPGHGTRWEDLGVTGWQDWYAEVDRELRLLRDRSARVFVAGLSMGGALALRLAARHGDAVSGVMVVNPANRVHGVAAHALPVLRHLVPATKGIASDIAKPVIRELGYDRVPLHAAHSLRNFFRLVDRELPQVTQPLLLMRSPQDHVVPCGGLGADPVPGVVGGRHGGPAGTELPRRDVGPRRGADLPGEHRVHRPTAPGAVREPGLGKEGTTAGG